MSDRHPAVNATPSPDERLIQIDQITDAVAKANASVKLACQMLPARIEISEEALETARIIEADEAKAQILLEIAPQLPEPERNQALEAVLVAAERIQDDRVRVSMLARVAVHFSGAERCREVATQATAIAQAWSAGQHLSEDIVNVLVTVIPLLPEPEQVAVLERAIAVAQTIADDKPRRRALVAIAPYLTAPFLDHALAIAESIREGQRDQALAALAPHLAEPQLERTLAGISRMADPWCLAGAIAAVVPCLSGGLMDRAIAISQSLQPPWARAYALSTIAAQLPEPQHIDLLHQALSYVPGGADRDEDTFSSEWNLSVTLRALVARIPEPLLSSVLDVIQLTEKELFDVFEHPLVQFSAQLQGAEPDLLERTLALIQNIQKDDERAQALTHIATCLPASQALPVLEQAAVLARSCQNNQLLMEISAHLPEPERQQTLEQVLTTVLLMTPDWRRRDLLKTILPHLPERFLKQAIATAKTLQLDPAERAQILAIIAPYLPENGRLPILELALNSALTVLLEQEAPHREKYRGLLAKLAPQLPLKLLEQALTTAQASWNQPAYAVTLRILAPHLSQPHLESAWTFAESIPEAVFRAAAIAILAPYLPIPLLERALETALAIAEKWSRMHALAGLSCRLLDIPNLSEEKRTQILEEVSQATQKVTNDWSAEADFYNTYLYAHIVHGILRLIPQLIHPLLNYITQSEFASDHNRFVYLEWLSPYVIRSVLPNYIDAVLNLPTRNSDSEIEEILALPAANLSEFFVQVFPQSKYSIALNVVKYIHHDADKVKFLSALIPRLSSSRLVEVLQLIELEIADEFYRVEALKNLFPYLSNDQLPRAFDCINHHLNEEEQKTAALESFITYFGGDLFASWHKEIYKTIRALIPTLSKAEYQARILHKLAVEFSKKEANEVFHGYGAEFPDLSKGFSNTHFASDIFDLTQSLSTVRQPGFSYESWAAKILTQLAPTLRRFRENKDGETALQETLGHILDGICQLQDPGFQAEVLAALPADRYFVDIARNCCPYETTASSSQLFYRVKVQLQLPFTGRPKLYEVFETLQAKASPYLLAAALVEMGRHPKGLATQRAALDAIRGLADSHLQALYLIALIPALGRQYGLEAASVIGDIEDPNSRAAARVALARQFPDSEFFIPARDAALTLASRVDQIEHLSNLAIAMPELLPRIIKIAEEIDRDPTPANLAKALRQPQEAYLLQIERRDILVALAPHLPVRINCEVDREIRLGHFVTPELYHRALYVLARNYRDALQGGTLRNDAAQDTDLLNLKDEINALSDLLLMRDLEPPMAVGILGGWGGGKSYIMHLMQARMTEIRSRRVDQALEAWHQDPNYEKLSPYVGHVYQIKFDAWTFAKSDLWASLMQTIFFELDRQITLEQQLFAVLETVPAAQRETLAEKVWPVLYKTNDADRKWFLERVLSNTDLLEKFERQLTNPEFTGFLWKTFQRSQAESLNNLAQHQAELAKVQAALNVRKAEIREHYRAQSHPVIQIQSNQQIQRADALLGTSLILLRQRIGQLTFKYLNNKVHERLEGNSPVQDSEQQPGLWQTLGKTMQEYEEISLQVAKKEQEPGPEPTTEAATLAELKTKADELLQRIEETKFDIYHVATQVIDQEYGRITVGSAWQWGKRNWILACVFVLFFVLPIGAITIIALVPEWNNAVLQWAKARLEQADQSITSLAALLATLTPGIIAFQAMLKTAQKWFDETNLALQEYQQRVETRTQQLETAIEQKVEAKIQADVELRNLENTVKQLESELQIMRAEMPENQYASLADFVGDRLQKGDYESTLGLMQQVQKDLAELSDRLLPPRQSDQSWGAKLKFLQAAFPRGPARVVVYIDDLDRCPPDCVVQVLEAVQLLVKTPLFIAVLAIDERYITRALEKFYSGVLLRRGSPSGTDYLEKIIQIPYRVRPIMADSLENYLRAQIRIQDSATSSTKFIEFSGPEFAMLLECCKQVVLSPRALKRLTNVYKLFKIVCRTRGTRLSLAVQQAILALLALSSRYPDIMRGIFDDIENCYEAQHPATNASEAETTLSLTSTLEQVFEQYQLPEHDKYLEREFRNFRYDALHTKILPPNLTLKEITHKIFNLLRSFSFVGEIGEDPEDYRYSGPIETEREDSRLSNTELLES